MPSRSVPTITSSGISTRREAYNAAVNDNNVAIDLFPGRIVAGIAGFHALEPLESFDTEPVAEPESGEPRLA